MKFVCLVLVICLYFVNCDAKILKAQKRRRDKVFFHVHGLRNFKNLSHKLEGTIIPWRFDARKKWPKCKSLFRISDQGDCGGCWAFATSSVMSDRLCIHSKQKLQDYVSTQDLLECCKQCVEDGDEDIGGCDGGYPIEAFKFWKSDGLVTGFDAFEGCKPIHKEIIKGIPYKTCRSECTNKKYKQSYNNSKIFAKNFFVQPDPLKNDLKQIQIELMKNGPIISIFDTYEYICDLGKNGVIFYDEKKVGKDEEAESHLVKLIGWDETKDGTPVWIIANSWGKDWCDSGFCRIKRGTNELNMESNMMIGGLPRIRSVSKKGTNKIDKTEFHSTDTGSKTVFINLLIFILEVTLSSHFL